VLVAQNEGDGWSFLLLLADSTAVLGIGSTGSVERLEGDGWRFLAVLGTGCTGSVERLVGHFGRARACTWCIAKEPC
jgi:hypothetical protein